MLVLHFRALYGTNTYLARSLLISSVQLCLPKSLLLYLNPMITVSFHTEHSLLYLIFTFLSSVCPVCMSIAWRPIRLVCGHVFCVRCLIKAQKKHMDDCPLCRHPTAVQQACALNLDVPMQNFMKMYFPKEIKQKKKENEREQALEDVQAIMGRAYTEEQLLRMNRRQQQDGQCTIM